MSDVAGGVPATGAGAVVDLLSADPPPQIRSVYSDLLDEALRGSRTHVTRQEVWVEEPGTRTGGRSVEVEG
jgi:hypothetical protein